MEREEGERGQGEEERKEDEDDEGLTYEQVERREAARAVWTIQKYGDLRVDPRASNTYKMAHLKQI